MGKKRPKASGRSPSRVPGNILGKSSEIREDDRTPSPDSPQPSAGQIWRNRGGELVATQAAMAGDGDRLLCLFLQPRSPSHPGYLVDEAGRFFPGPLDPQLDSPLDLATLEERSLIEKEEAARVGPRIGLRNDEDPGRVLEIFERVAAYLKKRGEGGRSRRDGKVKGVPTPKFSTTTSWMLDKISYEEDRIELPPSGESEAPQDFLIRKLKVSVDPRRPSGWWAVTVMGSDSPRIEFYNGTVGELFLLAGFLLPKETLLARMRGNK